MLDFEGMWVALAREHPPLPRERRVGHLSSLLSSPATAAHAYHHHHSAPTHLCRSVAKWLALTSEEHWDMSRRILGRCAENPSRFAPPASPAASPTACASASIPAGVHAPLSRATRTRSSSSCLAAQPSHFEARQLLTLLVHLPAQLRLTIADPDVAKHGAAWQAANNEDKSIATGRPPSKQIEC